MKFQLFNIQGKYYRIRIFNGYIYYQFVQFGYSGIRRMLNDECLSIPTRWDVGAYIS